MWELDALYLVTLSPFLIFNSPWERIKLAKVTIIHHIENHIHLEERVSVVGRKKMTVLLPLTREHTLICSFRSGRPEVFYNKGIPRNFPKFTGKYLCQSLSFNKVACLRPATLLKKRPRHRCFPVNFVKFLIAHFFIEHLWWLLLQLQKQRKKGRLKSRSLY